MPRRKKAFSVNPSDTDIRLMRVFKTVLECGGLSAAQTELGVGRSTISKQISDLEVRLGLRLCHRGRKGFSLTQDGSQAVAYIDRLLSAVDDFSSEIAGIHNRLEGKINIGVIDFAMSDPSNPIVPSITEFKETAPRVSIGMMIGSPNEVERGVIDGTLHLGVVPDYHRHPGIEYEIMYSEPVGLFCGRDHPLGQAVAAGETLTEARVREHQLVFRGYFESERLRERKQKFPVGSKVFQTEAVLALVRSGAYLGFFPVHCKDVFPGVFHELLPSAFQYSTPICVIWRSDRQHSPILQEFLDVLRERRGRGADAGRIG